MSIFSLANCLMSHLHQNGHEAYIVGGAVRDFYLNKDVHDIDIATSATPAEVQAIFPSTIPVGIEHGTIIVRYEKESFEVTTFRTESNYEDFRHPSQVQFVRSLTEDLKRRDFTMNAMALTSDGHCIDPYDGENDIRLKRLRAVGNANKRFAEDPLRMMRAFRFVSQLNFEVEQGTLNAIVQNAALIKNISMERIYTEFNKLLMGNAVEKSLRLMIETQFIFHLPYFNLDDGLFHLVLDYPLEGLRTLEERWCLFLWKLNLIEKTPFYKQWCFSKKTREKVIEIYQISQVMMEKSWTPMTVYKYGIENCCGADRLLSLIKNKEPDELSLYYLYEKLPIKKRSDLNITGTHLTQWIDKKPGPWINNLFDEIELAIVNGELVNNQEAIRRWVKRWELSNKHY